MKIFHPFSSTILKIKYLHCILIFVFVHLSVILPLNSFAQWIPIGKENSQPRPPKVSLISHNSQSTILKVDLFGFNLQDLVTEDREFKNIDLFSDVYTTHPGNPSIPYISKILAIPDNASVSYEILEVGNILSFKDLLLPPARESWEEGAPETRYLINDQSYESFEIYPQDYVSCDDPSVFRDFRITRVSIFPVRYIPAIGEVQVASSLTVRINYGTGNVINPKTAPKRSIAPSFGSLYRSTIFNYQEVLDKEYGGKEIGEEVLLYILPDNFLPFFTEYFEWKRLCGYTVITTKFSDIGATANNPNTILNHVSNLYFFSQYPPTYVILVGDDGVFPKKIVTYPSYSFPDEDFFVKVDGNDFFPEMFVGRIPSMTSDILQLLLKKFLIYEKTPHMTDTTWFRKGICCSNNAYLSQIETKRFTAQVMMNDGNFLSVDTLMSDAAIGTSQGCTMNLNTVLAAINDGRSFLNYRGEGWSSGWWANCYPFSTSQVNNVMNGEKFTFVTSIGCGVSMFNAGGGNCFGEQWLKIGTVDNPRGAVNFVGPTSNTHTAPNNRIDRGIYMGMFQEGMNTPGQGLLRGKLFLYQELGTDPMVEYHYNVYCDLGDPSTRIWKTTPRQIDADHPLTVEVFSDPFQIAVTYQATGLPAINANVNISSNNVLLNEKTNNQGLTTFSTSFSQVDTLQVTITGADILPYFGTIYVVPSSSDIQKEEITGSQLYQNLPNPFTSETKISYYLSNPTNVQLKIHNLNGSHIFTLTDEFKAPGYYTIEWNGQDVDGNKIKPGIYFYTLQTDTFSKTLRMLKLK